MSFLTKSVVLVALVAGLCGCGGKAFVRPDPDTLKNGETTYSQVIARLGEPCREGSFIENEKMLKKASYYYQGSRGEAFIRSVPRPPVASSSALFYFHDDVLVGYDFFSTMSKDYTHFTESNRHHIVKGKTTRAEVIQRMGKPHGAHIFPMIKAPAGEVVVYASMDWVQGHGLYRKELRITFDTSGIVMDMEYSDSMGGK